MGEFFIVFLVVAIIAIARFARYVFRPYTPPDEDLSSPERVQEMRRAIREQLDIHQRRTESKPPLPVTSPAAVRANSGRSTRQMTPEQAVPPQAEKSANEQLSVSIDPAPSMTNPPEIAFDWAAVEQELDAAGMLLLGSGEELPVPGYEARARVVQLKNFKKMAIVPETAPAEWIREIMSSYDYVLQVGAEERVVIRTLRGFMQDYLFR